MISYTIFTNPVIQKELNRLEAFIDPVNDRDVNADIQILKDALTQLDKELWQGKKPFAFIDYNMWEECKDSLAVILNEFNLQIDTKAIGTGEYDVCVVRKEQEVTQAVQPLDIAKILTVSTAHITEATAFYLNDESRGELSVYKKEDFGWFLFLGGELDEENNVPAELINLIEFSKKQDCLWLCLDCDGDILIDFPICQW